MAHIINYYYYYYFIKFKIYNSIKISILVDFDNLQLNYIKAVSFCFKFKLWPGQLAMVLTNFNTIIVVSSL